MEVWAKGWRGGRYLVDIYSYLEGEPHEFCIWGKNWDCMIQVHCVTLLQDHRQRGTSGYLQCIFSVQKRISMLCLSAWQMHL